MTPLDRFTCEETFRRLDDYMDRELSPAELAAVEAHLSTCAVCTREFRFEATVLQQVRGKVERLAAPQDLLGRILGQLPASPSESSGHDD